LRYGCRALLISSLVLAAHIPTSAQEMKSPRIWAANPDWKAARSELEALVSSNSQQTGSRGQREFVVSLARELNAETRRQFANISESPVPVLLPFDTAAFLRDRSAIGPVSQQASPNVRYFFGFNSVPFFHAGPTGYDAVVVARANEMRDLGISYSNPIYVHVSGFSFLYELAEPVGMTELPVNGHDEFATVRGILLEDWLRYSFTRYGVPYVISIECFDGGSRYGKISCQDADKVALRTLQSLRLIGGLPDAASPNAPAGSIDRPAAESTVFTYHSPGDLIAGTGFKNKGGAADYTVFLPMRFPMAHAPAFANSQSFLNAGDCEAMGRSSAGVRDGMPAYRCRMNGETLVWNEAAGQNYSYPWRDNFCEMRHFQVGQCPTGLGHQGQDIRPAFCRQRNPGDPCEPNVHEVVAVRDGMVLRAPGQLSVQLVVNAAGVRARLRYLHMPPKQLDADGLLSGRIVREGEVIGKVGKFLTPYAATTTHLHFDLQVPTKYGWVFVNPYMTLVASYEWLIRGRGQEIKRDRPMETKGDRVISTLSSSSPRPPGKDRTETDSDSGD
jgi:hypothetical protein